LPIVETDVANADVNVAAVNGLICERKFFKKELKNGKKHRKP
jgi:hypothetical protein